LLNGSIGECTQLILFHNIGGHHHSAATQRLHLGCNPLKISLGTCANDHVRSRLSISQGNAGTYTLARTGYYRYLPIQAKPVEYSHALLQSKNGVCPRYYYGIAEKDKWASYLVGMA
jgi:hypothetical protein